jgi:hypothetical protein
LQGNTKGYDAKIITESANKALKEVKAFKEEWNSLDDHFYNSYKDNVYRITPDQYTSSSSTSLSPMESSISKSISGGISYSPEYGVSTGGVGGIFDSADAAFTKNLVEYLKSSDFKYTDKL